MSNEHCSQTREKTVACDRMVSRILTCLMLAITLMLVCAPRPTWAADQEIDQVVAAESAEDEATEEVIEVDAPEQDIVPGGDEDPSELLDAYAEQCLDANLPRSDGPRHAAPDKTRELLSENSLVVCNALEDMICEVAAGDRTSTVFAIPVESVLSKLTYTAEELGVSAIVANGAITSEAQAAADEKVAINLSDIVAVLLAEHPYELYWYEKTASTRYSGVSYGASGYGDSYTLTIKGSYTFFFPVANDYATGSYSVDPSSGTRVTQAVANANSIVQSYAGLDSYERLCGFKNEICSRVTYNYSAAAGGASYGDPWQLVSVFDGDPSTNVVCEGYSKAFKYLCDLAADEDVSCIVVTGVMDGGTGAGRHMWNIVNMADGNNYMVDVTNCDEGTVGADDKLFLAGYTEGSVSEGYVFVIDSDGVSYTYDSSMRGLYGEEGLALSDTAYNSASGTVYEDGWVNLGEGRKGYAQDGSLVTGWLDLDGAKYYFEDDGTMVTGWYELGSMRYYFRPSGNLARSSWADIDGEKYYFRPSGNMATGWTDVNGAKYYLDDEGHMVTGWLTLGSGASARTYYLRTSGTMATGFQTIDGVAYLFRATGSMATGWADWDGKKYYLEDDGTLVRGTWKHIVNDQGVDNLYYFRPSGSMATGWAQIDGAYYYFRPSGNRATGWADVSDDAYKRYFDADGQMLTGWQTIEGKQYYFRVSSGAMQTGEATIDGEQYTFSNKGVLIS